MQRSTRIFNIAFSLPVPITTRHPCRDYMNTINVLCTTLKIMHAPNQSSAAEYLINWCRNFRFEFEFWAQTCDIASQDCLYNCRGIQQFQLRPAQNVRGDYITTTAAPVSHSSSFESPNVGEQTDGEEPKNLHSVSEPAGCESTGCRKKSGLHVSL